MSLCVGPITSLSNWGHFHPSLTSQLRKLKFFLDLVFNDSNKVIILFLNSKSFFNWMKLGENTRYCSSQHLYVHRWSRPYWVPPGNSCQGMFVYVTQEMSWGIVFEVALKKKRFFVSQRIWTPFCNSPTLIFPLWPLISIAQHKGEQPTEGIQLLKKMIRVFSNWVT